MSSMRMSVAKGGPFTRPFLSDVLVADDAEGRLLPMVSGLFLMSTVDARDRNFCGSAMLCISIGPH